MTSKTPHFHIFLVLPVLGLVACAGPSPLLTTPAVTETAINTTEDESPDLVRLVSVFESNELSEGAVIQMLAFREHVYLPFASSRLYDPRLIDLSSERQELTAGFADLGLAGQQVLELCAFEALFDVPEFVHLPGDDSTLMGRECLEMIGEAYGLGGLPFLVSFSTMDPRPNPDAVLLQRAALDVIQDMDLDPDVWTSREPAEWRYEVAHWANYLKELELELADAVWGAEPITCDSMCETILFFQWVTAAAQSTNRIREGEELRQVTTLRAFVERRAVRWRAWLEEVSRAILFHGRGEITPEEVRLVVELWVRSAAATDPSRFHETVLPLVAWSIDPTDIERHTGIVEVDKDGSMVSVVDEPTTSQVLVWALEDATGLALEHPSCDPLAFTTPESIRECLAVQAVFWREITTLRRWEI